MREISDMPGPGLDLFPYISTFLEAERQRCVSGRTVRELADHLSRLRSFCLDRGVPRIEELTAAVLKDFLLWRNPQGRPPLGKALVWTLRRFGSHLALNQALPDNPASGLHHPRISPRHRLPQYLNAGELRRLLESVSDHGTLQDLTVLSLLATVGARPTEICNLRREDVDTGCGCVYLRVKGNWHKRTPISESMSDLLKEYLATVPHERSRIFLNTWHRPLETRWVQRRVRDAARMAGIRRHVTPLMLRHSFATYAADRHGAPLTRALLGHCGRSHSTAVYLHLAPSKYRPLMNIHPYQTTLKRGRR